LSRWLSHANCIYDVRDNSGEALVDMALKTFCEQAKKLLCTSRFGCTSIPLLL
jgi:hypothetical protein